MDEDFDILGDLFDDPKETGEVRGISHDEIMILLTNGEVIFVEKRKPQGLPCG